MFSLFVPGVINQMSKQVSYIQVCEWELLSLITNVFSWIHEHIVVCRTNCLFPASQYHVADEWNMKSDPRDIISFSTLWLILFSC
jgi:hypothetical protein